VKSIIVISVSILMAWSTLACDFSNPHSLSCQKQTFEGKIFPLELIDFRFLTTRWVPSQFTSANPRHPIQFRTIKAESSRHKTCGVVTPTGNMLGNLNVHVSRFGIEAASIFFFLNYHFSTNHRPFYENAFTLVFSNSSSRDILRCRVFDRINIPHLTCQYYKNRILVGYLGFLPHKESCE